MQSCLHYCFACQSINQLRKKEFCSCSQWTGALILFALQGGKFKLKGFPRAHLGAYLHGCNVNWYTIENNPTLVSKLTTYLLQSWKLMFSFKIWDYFYNTAQYFEWIGFFLRQKVLWHFVTNNKQKKKMALGIRVDIIF